MYKIDLNGHTAGERYYKHHEVNGEAPKELLELDKNTKPYNFSEIDKTSASAISTK